MDLVLMGCTHCLFCQRLWQWRKGLQLISGVVSTVFTMREGWYSRHTKAAIVLKTNLLKKTVNTYLFCCLCCDLFCRAKLAKKNFWIRQTSKIVRCVLWFYPPLTSMPLLFFYLALRQTYQTNFSWAAWSPFTLYFWP